MIARLPPAAVLAMALLASPTAAQGRIVNARIEQRMSTGPLDREVQAAAARGTVWIGYRVPMVDGRRSLCCYDSTPAAAAACCGRCRLEGGGGVMMNDGGWPDPQGTLIAIEPPAEFLILARVENGSVTRLRTFTPECEIDGEGMPLVWLDNVAVDASVAWLTTLVRAAAGNRERENRLVQPALSALALHHSSAAVTALVATARDDGRAPVRGQALFWLAQRAGQEAVAAIDAAIARDPDTEVKKQAVFALSRLPMSEGIPLLIQVARTNRNGEVRRQAMFWLGQSRDPRAVSFFEEILTKR